ncbi:hypothetical protein A3SI_15483 [Nitritalea halalkaliphila LW7]|uniref:Uncharacterized protein n=1 Tax=Nitritalea halalkaliphila LW7 TaxID=1189621 RepID=I5BYE2_9BACT|nr:hypothetical protein [Nitritalea halalkaliphila]EIM74594.1 hypothetical protein A3SI_15483 [Nitritalea halalkaliphila LW7]
MINLVHAPNEANWFAAYNLRDPQVAFCSTLLGDDFKRRKSGRGKNFYAIYSHVLIIYTAMLFRSRNSRTDYTFYHEQGVSACVFDFNRNKEEVLTKLRSGMICESCMKSMAAPENLQLHGISADVAYFFLEGLQRALNRVRNIFSNHQLHLFFPPPRFTCT